MAIAGRKARVKVTGVAVPVTAEAATSETLSIYRITNAARRIMAPAVAVTVEQSTNGGANWNTVTAYTLNRLEGRVNFTSARGAGTLVRVNYSYLPVTTALEGRNYSYSIIAKNDDDTQYGDDWQSRMQVTLDCKGTIDTLATLDRYFASTLLAGTAPVVIELWSDNAAAAPDLRFWALLDTHGLQAAIDSVQKNPIEWSGAGDAEGTVCATNLA
jgi:hypothetical protein